MEFWDLYTADRILVGRTHVRGDILPMDNYHMVVRVCILNTKGECLISKRASDKVPWPNLWEIPGGAAVAGEDSLMAALREVKEELGIKLDPSGGITIGEQWNDECFIDVWRFVQDVDIRDIQFQPGETCDAMWVSEEKTREMINSGAFPPGFDDYFNLLF